jgi:aminoglycoside/choline kinase family phosphotransferase
MRPFVEVAEAFVQVGIHVPHILHQDLEQGFLLLSDLGQDSYLDELNADSVQRLYGDALSTLATIQACGPRETLPEYGVERLQTEMSLFDQWLVQDHLGLTLSDAEQQMLARLHQQLTDNALAQPQVCVHRDYHSRNLMRTEPNPGVIDFQDAVLGPVTYDLVSLLKDCYIAWPREQVKDWAMGYFELALQSGILFKEHEDDFLRWFDLMGVQRHLKAAGIFARLKLRDGKPGYIKDIPRTLGYILEIAPEYPKELTGLASLIEQRVLPALTERL